MFLIIIMHYSMDIITYNINHYSNPCKVLLFMEALMVEEVEISQSQLSTIVLHLRISASTYMYSIIQKGIMHTGPA